MGRAEQITREIRFHDRLLYCEKNKEGTLCIFRKGFRLENYDFDGKRLSFVRPTPHLVMALTHNWKVTGQSVDWGTLPIIERLNSIDLHNRNLADELLAKYEKRNHQKQREFSSKNEDFLKEFRKPFAKATSDINTSCMAKIDKRRLKE